MPPAAAAHAASSGRAASPAPKKTHPGRMGDIAAAAGGMCGRSGLEIAGLALLAMALVALGRIAKLSLCEDKLHFHLASAIAKKLLRDDPNPCILA
jgi:hypothetical protein